MASLQIHLFGSPRLELDNTPLSLGRRNTLALLAYLAVTGRPHRRESLLTLLFPDHEPTTARRYLRRDLSHLNQKLGSGWINADRAEVGMNQEANSWVDVVHFRDLLGAAQRHQHQDGSLCPDCLASLARAADIYTGDFMSGFSLPEAPDFNDWLFFERESLRQDLAGLLQTLSAYHGGRGEYAAAIL
jgi:DNA-binding SARP family transcriptional activator